MKGVFASLDKLEKMLQGKDYLIGDRLTEADIRLYVTIVRPSFRSTGTTNSIPSDN